METNNMKVTHPFQSVKFDRIAYIGAGMGEHLEELTAALNSSEWLLIEGDEKKIPTLQKKASEFEAENRKIYIKSTILSADGELKTWYNYNLDEYSGLAKATGLNELFPGLKLQSSEAISTQAISEALAEFSSAEGVNGLIIDIPGQSEELLNALYATENLTNWRFLAITTTDTPLFDSSEDAEGIKQHLSNAGYHTRGELGDDPDFPVLYYVLSEAQQQLIAERDQALSRATDAEKQRDEAVARASSASKELEQLKQQFNEKSEQADSAQTKVEELEQAVNQANEEKQKQTEWAHSLQTKLEEAVAEKGKLAERAEKAEAQIEDLQTSVKEVSEERDGAAAKASNASKELEQLKQQLNEKSEQADSAQTKIEELEQAVSQANEEKQKHTDWAHNLKKQLEQTQAELKEQQRSAQLSTKLLAKVEADASELRERYAEKVKSEQELKDLIKELHAKLQAASHFYHKLEQEHPELLEKL
ncbi:hypothetical protein [Idiomarina sp.]|uniref:hypothetical protein n=1 Tax=Idiomarina sp. TaxID=1874361 RepID=UPI0026064ED4|nr:hypothetical protein [Idiomarina sp.]